MAEPIRLQKAISAAGLMSRRAAEILISEGRITVDGIPAILGSRVDPDSQVVAIDGEVVPVAPDRVTYLLYKPVGIISTASDPHGRSTVVQLVPENPRVWPVGRLDADSEGLILLSNDGSLTNFVTHPRYGITKTYSVLARGLVDERSLRKLTTGIDLEDGPAQARKARLIGRGEGRSLVEVEMNEGRNREVRRMFEVIGYPVERLIRTAIGHIVDRNLAPGTFRKLALEEVMDLYRIAGSEMGKVPGAQVRP